MSRARIRRSFVFASLAFMALAGCDNMKHQENVRAFDPSTKFADGASARLPPLHTVARGVLAPDNPLTSGKEGGVWAVALPIPVTRELVMRGRERFEIFCADCHGEDGYGRGIVVMRGFPRPESFHDARLRGAPVGLLFGAVTRGHGIMYGFADRIGPSDRWGIVAYIRALQKSQNAAVAELSPDERAHLPAP